MGRRGAVLLGLLLVGCGGAESASPGPVGGADGSMYGVFTPLFGVAAVVEATVVGHRGSVGVANEFGGTNHAGRSEDAGEWTTPDGFPVVVVADLELVESIGGYDKGDKLVADVNAEVTSGRSIEVIAPVGVYDEGERYEFWLAPYREIGYRTSLVFDSAGEAIEGLDLAGGDDEYERLAEHAGMSRVAVLAAMAREMNAGRGDGAQGELMDFVFGPQSFPSAEIDSTLDDLASGRESVQVDVSIIGGQPGEHLGLQGLRPVAWSVIGPDGHTSIHGSATVGAELALVALNDVEGDPEPVNGAPLLQVGDTPGEFRALYDLDDDGRITLRTGLSLPELDTLVRADLGLPPETDG